MTWHTITKDGFIECHHDSEPNAMEIEWRVRVDAHCTVVALDGVGPFFPDSDEAEPYPPRKFRLDSRKAYNFGQTTYYEVEA